MFWHNEMFAPKPGAEHDKGRKRRGGNECKCVWERHGVFSAAHSSGVRMMVRKWVAQDVATL